MLDCALQRRLGKTLRDLEAFCTAKDLQINVPKTKVLVFHNGRLPTCQFSLKGQPLERVKEFKYLGVTFTSQVVSSAHLQELSIKARARIGFLFPCLNLRNLPLPLVLRVFQTFILPIYGHALPIWITSPSHKTYATRLTPSSQST